MDQKQQQLFSSKPTVTSIIAGGRRRLNYTFEDKSEMVEEYDIKTHELLSRRFKKKLEFKETSWVYEIGEAPSQDQSEVAIQPSNSNPIFIRKDTQQHYQYRIRNLPYPEDVYLVEVDEVKQEIVIKTTIKKYYKRCQSINQLYKQILNPRFSETWYTIRKRQDQMGLQEQYLPFICKKYPKPDPIIKREEEIRLHFEKFNSKNPKEGDIECVQQ